MKQEPERKDVASKHREVYIKTAPLLVGLMHDFLFKEIYSFLISKDKDEKTLLQIGPGSAMLPFSKYPEKVSKMLGEKGKIVLLDYSDKNIEAAIRYLLEKDFLKKSGLKLNSVELVTNPKSLEARTITFVQGDIREPLPFENNSFDCIDITLVGHHVTPFLSDLDRLTSDLHRVLVKRGMIHYGEGSVYMDSESRINILGSDTADFFNDAVLFVDERDEEFKRYGLFQKGVKNAKFPEKKNPSIGNIELFLDKEGNVTLSANSDEEASKYIKFLKTKGRKHLDQIENIVLFPLIDEENKFDKIYFIDPIWSFYGNLFHKIQRSFQNDTSFRNEAVKVVKEEFYNAKRGLVEFYKSIKVISRSMKASRFKDIKRKMHKKSGHKKSQFGSIVAIK